ncbi:MAG: M20/M25/M40 family metallo-hydrolase [Bryobacterales bacterium]|nr:M20/M25/M40 family metallo-hydrolase [Bryobacterales bacterium]
MRVFRIVGVSLALAGLVHGQDISGPRLRAHVKFLASDLLEGRGVGTRGGELAEQYIATQLQLLGAQPAGENGTYLQKVPLVGIQPLPSANLRFGNQDLRWLEEFVGTNQTQKESSAIDAEAIFVGHGISAPEWGWDDYKGVDVKGKVVVLFTGEPPSTDPTFFDGRALTYYGRWTYKYEEATRRGAAGAIIVHTTPTASYGWDVVKSSWGREDMAVKLEPGAHALSFAGWITQPIGDKLFSSQGKTAEQMLTLADTKGFQPVPLNVRFQGTFPTKIRTVESNNVIGIIPGSDAALKAEAVVFSAHWDHLGVGTPVNGDRIHNGAVDNATGCAMVLEMARAWQNLNPKPRRSALFLFVTAEENGLRGSEYFGRHPTVSLDKLAVNLNYDAFYPFGRTTDVVVTGAERTSIWALVQHTAQRFRLSIKPDPRPEAGHYFRSDHFSLAKVGVPAFSINGGDNFAGKPEGFGAKVFGDYNSKHYHQPSDEYSESWDMAGMEEMAKFGFTLGLDVANSPKLPARLK